MSRPQSPPSGDKLLKKALNKHNAGDARTAKTLYQRIIRKNPMHLDAHYLLGTLCAEQNDLPSALKYLAKAAELAPTSPNIQNNLGNVYLKSERLDEAAACYRKALLADPKMTESSFNLGQVLLRQGSPEEAAACFEKAIFFNPSFGRAHAELAKIYKETGRSTEAVASYRQALSSTPDALPLLHELANVLAARDEKAEAVECYERILALAPEDGSARHALAALKGETTDAAPTGHVEGLFDAMAPSFEHHLGELGYRIPTLLQQRLAETAGNDTRFRHTLDLGCGTGLVGAAFRPMTERLTGVDLSAGMIEKAREKKIYDQLHAEEIAEYLNRADDKYDLIVATDVFVYIGNLDPLFGAVARRCMEGGRFLFSIEGCESGDYRLLTTGRYAHSASYIETLAGNHGFSMEIREAADIRKEKAQPIPGHIFILKRVP